MVKVLIECQICGKGADTGESATIVNDDGEEVLIQSRDGGFVCKECWKKFMGFLHDDTVIILCGSDEHEPPEKPEKEGEQIAADDGEKIDFMTERWLIQAKQKMNKEMDIAHAISRKVDVDVVEQYQLGIVEGLLIAFDILKEPGEKEGVSCPRCKEPLPPKDADGYPLCPVCNWPDEPDEEGTHLWPPADPVDEPEQEPEKEEK